VQKQHLKTATQATVYMYPLKESSKFCSPYFIFFSRIANTIDIWDALITFGDIDRIEFCSRFEFRGVFVRFCSSESASLLTETWDYSLLSFVAPFSGAGVCVEESSIGMKLTMANDCIRILHVRENSRHPSYHSRSGDVRGYLELPLSDQYEPVGRIPRSSSSDKRQHHNRRTRIDFQSASFSELLQAPSPSSCSSSLDQIPAIAVIGSHSLSEAGSEYTLKACRPFNRESRALVTYFN